VVWARRAIAATLSAMLSPSSTMRRRRSVVVQASPRLGFEPLQERQGGLLAVGAEIVEAAYHRWGPAEPALLGEKTDRPRHPDWVRTGRV